MAREYLCGARVALSGLEKEHLELRVAYINDPVVQKTLNFDVPASLSKTEVWFSKVALDNSRVDLSVFCTKSRDLIGFCGFIDIDRVSSKAEHYIFIGNTNYWGQGFGKDVYKLLTNYGFLRLGMNKLYGYQLLNNERAARVTSALGWSVEGILRKNIYSHGCYQDQRYISLLRDEWLENPTYNDV